MQGGSSSRNGHATSAAACSCHLAVRDTARTLFQVRPRILDPVHDTDGGTCRTMLVLALCENQYACVRLCVPSSKKKGCAANQVYSFLSLRDGTNQQSFTESRLKKE
uniref:Uncharacterized protein n=1 Tax=Arundo donax TaxID=35708 RepID=A0A0A9R5A4_ARUDO